MTSRKDRVVATLSGGVSLARYGKTGHACLMPVAVLFWVVYLVLPVSIIPLLILQPAAFLVSMNTFNGCVVSRHLSPPLMQPIARPPLHQSHPGPAPRECPCSSTAITMSAQVFRGSDPMHSAKAVCRDDRMCAHYSALNGDPRINFVVRADLPCLPT